MISSDQVLPDEQKDLEKDVEWEIKLPIFTGSYKRQEKLKNNLLLLHLLH